jgi:hypothetical protein
LISALRGQCHRLFTDEQQSIADYIVQNYLVPGVLLTEATLREIATIAYLEKFQDDQILKPFNWTTGFIAGFKKRSWFSSRRSHLKRQPLCAMSKSLPGYRG